MPTLIWRHHISLTLSRTKSYKKSYYDYKAEKRAWIGKYDAENGLKSICTSPAILKCKSTEEHTAPVTILPQNSKQFVYIYSDHGQQGETINTEPGTRGLGT